MGSMGVDDRASREGDTPSAHRVVVVGVDLDPSSGTILKRTARLATALRARLCVLHVLPRSVRTLRTKPVLTRDVVAAWTASDGVAVAKDDIFVEVGDVVTAVTLASDRLAADLLVLGRPSSDKASELAGVLGLLDRPTLLVDRRSELQQRVLAATDLRAAGHPVVATAAWFADALATDVSLIHNVEVTATPLSTIVERLQALERIANEREVVRAARVTTEARVEAILGEARRTQADVIAVGVRPGHGRTATSLISNASTRSLLVVPIGSGAAPPVLS